MSNLKIDDIARLAKVSTATVSRALHSPHLLKPDTLQRVLATMREHKYIYNALAGDLSKRKSAIIGVYAPSVESVKLSESIFAIQEAVQAQGYPVIVNNTQFDAEVERSLLRQARERSLSGVLLIGFMRENMDYIDGIIAAGIPTFFLWDVMPGAGYNYVGFDNQAATRQMTDYLIGIGHRRIAFVGAMQSKIDRVRKRLDGFMESLHNHSIDIDPNMILEAPPTLDNGCRTMKRLIARGGGLPTAVFFASDMLALGAMAACREEGLDVPGDISIAGFDDIGYAGYCQPALTTVGVPGREIGLLAGKLFLDVMENADASPRQVCLETTLMIRESCAAPRMRERNKKHISHSSHIKLQQKSHLLTEGGFPCKGLE